MGKKSTNKNEEKQKKNKSKLSVDELLKKVESLQEENETLKTQLKRALADYANLQKNNENRVQRLMEQTKRDVAKRLIELSDDIYYAMESLDKADFSEKAQSWLDGLIQTLSKVDKILADIGVTVLGCAEGDSFDSKFHEAIGIMPGGKKDTIAKVVQRCFVMGDSVVRPARVLTYSGDKSKKIFDK